MKTNRENAAIMCKSLITMLEKEEGYMSYTEILQTLSNNLDPTKKKDIFTPDFKHQEIVERRNKLNAKNRVKKIK